MEFIIYVLISMSLSSIGEMNYYSPTIYGSKLECEEIRTRMAEVIKTDSIIGSTSVCVKITVVPKKEV